MYTTLAYVKIKGKEFPDLLKSLMNLEYVVDEQSFMTNWKLGKDCYVYNLLYPDGSQYCHFSCNKNKPFAIHSKYFDCKDNLKAFLKIIAMRDDTDMNQYFVDEDGAEWVNLGMRIEPGSLEKCLTEKKIVCFNSPKTHRASAQEIFNYFEKNKDSEL